jgi:hypothetical protein
MNNEISNSDPAEGSREVIERELQRQDETPNPSQSGQRPQTPKPDETPSAGKDGRTPAAPEKAPGSGVMDGGSSADSQSSH